jgi:hypothetical protein
MMFEVWIWYVEFKWIESLYVMVESFENYDCNGTGIRF